MVVPYWIWCAFVFAFGSCIGSFLNVVIYRLPRDKSLALPPSSCPACNKRIAFYDNIPLISWLLLRGKCRHCKASISFRYFVVEFLTGAIFTALFILYFIVNIRDFQIDGQVGLASFVNGGWFVYLVLIILLSALIASSGIDLELWIIPISICWFITAVGLIGSAIWPYIVGQTSIVSFNLLPSASANTAALAVGAAIGLIISLILLSIGLIKTSYNEEVAIDTASPEPVIDDPNINHRLEVCKEIVFLLPIIICSLAVSWITKNNSAIGSWWDDFSQIPLIAGLTGSLFGYFVGGAVVWVTRILGTLAFGKEAMGLGDVHLMAAAGTIIGPISVVVAFFIAPFFGLTWAAGQMFFKKTRQIPYGPFLSLGIFAVIILYDWIFRYLEFMFIKGI